jgi:hypothetical protein
MDKYQIFAAWAPPASPWSAWAKPAPFAQLPPELALPPPLTPRLPIGIPPASARTAIVVATRGVSAIEHGLALAAAGYQPVPLFNACPMPPVFTAQVVRSAIDAGALVKGLVAGASALTTLRVPPDAPPVFLIDAARMTPEVLIDDDTFDNRSVIFASDLPSVHFLRRQGITNAVLVHDAGISVGGDLIHALRPWKAGGLSISTITAEGAPLEVRWPREGFLGRIEWRLFALFRLRRNPWGGFGAFVPESTGG